MTRDDFIVPKGVGVLGRTSRHAYAREDRETEIDGHANSSPFDSGSPVVVVGAPRGFQRFRKNHQGADREIRKRVTLRSVGSSPFSPPCCQMILART